MYRIRSRILHPETPSSTTWFDDGVVEIVDGRIHDVRPWDGEAVDVYAPHGVMTPGFVDAHIHAAQTRILGAASGTLLDWLAQSTFPEETRFADPAHASRVYTCFARALAAAGTTLSMVYGSVHAAQAHHLFKALDEQGLRAIAGPVWMNDGGPPELMVQTAEMVAGMEALLSRWHGHDGRLQLAVLPRFGLSCTADALATAGRFAQDHGLWCSTHLSETRAECQATTDRFGTHDYLEVYERAGLVHERAVFAHCIHLSPSEWARLAKARSVIAHCPDSNDFLGSGGMPIQTVLDLGVPWTLGTDVAAGRTFRVPRIASSAHDNALRMGHRVDPRQWFWQATRGGALALDHPHIGGVAKGLEADLVLHALPAWVEDAETALSWLLFHHDAPQAMATWVRGRLVWSREAHQGYFPWSD